MKSHTEYIWMNTKEHREFINITPLAEAFIAKSGIKEGFCLVSTMHTTSAIYVNDADSGLIQDFEDMLERLAPFNEGYMHHHTGESNGDSHMKCLLVHHQSIVPITGGKLDLGPWQQIYYAEFDGQRRKRILFKAIGE